MLRQFCWGPLSFVVALMVTFEHPLRHPLQALVSLGQIYGDVLYYATSMFDHYHKGITYCRPEAYYFWGYYFFMNFIWIVIPGSESQSGRNSFMVEPVAKHVSTVLLYSSISQTADAFRFMARNTKADGHVKKSN